MRITKTRTFIVNGLLEHETGTLCIMYYLSDNTICLSFSDDPVERFDQIGKKGRLYKTERNALKHLAKIYAYEITNCASEGTLQYLWVRQTNDDLYLGWLYGILDGTLKPTLITF